jgi:demethoxyubiquinone hydroxylase (CLK1/Coq7/Cat5 family)
LRSALASALGRVASQGSPSALLGLWSSAAGAVTAGVTRVTRYDAGVLVVEVETAQWADALRGQVPQLEQRLRSELSGFRRLELQLRGAP